MVWDTGLCQLHTQTSNLLANLYRLNADFRDGL